MICNLRQLKATLSRLNEHLVKKITFKPNLFADSGTENQNREVSQLIKKRRSFEPLLKLM